MSCSRSSTRSSTRPFARRSLGTEPPPATRKRSMRPPKANSSPTKRLARRNPRQSRLTARRSLRRERRRERTQSVRRLRTLTPLPLSASVSSLTSTCCGASSGRSPSTPSSSCPRSCSSRVVRLMRTLNSRALTSTLTWATLVTPACSALKSPLPLALSLFPAHSARLARSTTTVLTLQLRLGSSARPAN